MTTILGLLNERNMYNLREIKIVMYFLSSLEKIHSCMPCPWSRHLYPKHHAIINSVCYPKESQWYLYTFSTELYMKKSEDEWVLKTVTQTENCKKSLKQIEGSNNCTTNSFQKKKDKN